MTLAHLATWLRRFVLVLTAFGGATVACAQESGSSLAIAIHVRPSDRAALRADLVSAQASRLGRWKAQGLVAGYRLFFNRYADSASWDAIEILSFRDAASLARWNTIERASVGGLDADAAKLVQSVDTTPIDFAMGGGGNQAQDPSVLVIPYLALVPPPEYAEYLRSYTVPQFEGWIGEGVLDGYEIYTAIYPAGRPWNAMIVLRYRDSAALARRADVVAKVRARLASDPAWKAISDNKKAVRSEGVVAVADQLAGSDGR